MIVDGRALAGEVLARTKERAERLPHPPRVIAYVAQEPTLATRSYLNFKKKSAEAAGCFFEETSSVSFFAGADAAIVQLPVSSSAMAMLDTLPIRKDADVLSSAARAKFARGDADALLPPVVDAIAEIFRTYAVDPKGKKAAVIGAGFLVGGPAATWLARQGAVVDVVTPGDDLAVLRDADIIVSGAGSPHLIRPEMLKEGVVLIDAGTSELGGKVAGDADPSCAEVCSLFTPVPGGIGPLAVACLFENAVTLLERAIHT
ncbi:MAG TPA: bifunctional 5,10-methylenetetrahydrofolate dehydrogenase/5,10-methenyltetrahydrofolate cyclohydrolase [Candidatus Paceibacterota bacterium]|nr:bifunctional 5,10-methylenetetrahydrofolate dehydrogenase/5,10-methenyltetrahydrofolate cyclohydrolase [Candidatus Paceibacterota bacterium]